MLVLYDEMVGYVQYSFHIATCIRWRWQCHAAFQGELDGNCAMERT